MTYRVGGSAPRTVLVTPGAAPGEPAWNELLTWGMCEGWVALVPNGTGDPPALPRDGG
ncbi:MAG TPA: hypothetical protein VFJ09_10950 [Nocardioidaceae bacterium]|nr:hypothetical protein [Nocardioidaceae bacterium]